MKASPKSLGKSAKAGHSDRSGCPCTQGGTAGPASTEPTRPRIPPEESYVTALCLLRPVHARRPPRHEEEPSGGGEGVSAAGHHVTGAVQELLAELSQRRVTLSLHEGRVVFRGPREALDPALLRAMRDHRAALVDHVQLQGTAALSTGRFDPETLLQEAYEAAGSDDLGPEPDALVEALARFCESAEADAQLNGIGRVYVLERILRLSLHNRLRLADTLHAAPRPERAPLVVCGLPRSGTTLLHRLLCLADDAEGIPLWQLMEPVAVDAEDDQRRERARRNVDWIRGLARQDLDAQHLTRVDLPEECAHILQLSFFGNQLWKVPATSWMRWWMHADGGPAYRAWAATLAHLEPADARLVLKDPFHASWIDEVFAVCPEAMVVQTHRDPLEVLPSLHKLCRTSHEIFSDRRDLAETVELQTRWIESVIARSDAARIAAPQRLVVDVRYPELVADPVATVGRIHDAFGLPLTTGHESRMRDWLAEHPRGRFGANRYRIEDFAQRPDGLAERFAAYRQQHDLTAPPELQ